MNQLWHFDPDLLKSVKIQAKDLNGTFLESKTMEGWYSSYYGKKEASDYYMFSTAERNIKTEIEIIQ
jgi:serine protease inhibitor ecotin